MYCTLYSMTNHQWIIKTHIFILSHLLLLFLHQFSHLLSRQGRNGHTDQVLEIPQLTASRSLNTHPSMIFVSNKDHNCQSIISAQFKSSHETLKQTFLQLLPFVFGCVSAKKTPTFHYISSSQSRCLS